MIDSMVGQTIVDITNNGNLLIFHMSDGSRYKMYHAQDCCEYVFIEDICGSLEDLIGTPLVRAEERSSYDCEESKVESCEEHYMWTFYEFATIKGSVTIRWYGESNGYYSISVDLRHEKASGIGERVSF